MRQSYGIGIVVGAGVLTAMFLSALGCSSSSSGKGTTAKDSGVADSSKASTDAGIADSSNGNTDSNNSTADSGTVGATDSGPTAPSEGGAVDAGPLGCSAYCAGILATCTGDNAQYADMPSCMSACAQLPLGTAADTSGDTIGCRMYHTTLAMAAPDPHCWHAGPYGFGGCGANCDAFCTIAIGWCSPDAGFTGGAPPYASSAAGTAQVECATECAAYTTVNGEMPDSDGGFNALGPGAGNTLDCREYHLSASWASPAAQALHCNHVGESSPVCM